MLDIAGQAQATIAAPLEEFLSRRPQPLLARVIPIGAACVSLVLLAGCSAAGATDPATNAAPVRSVTIVSGQSAQNGELLQRIFDDYNETGDGATVQLQMKADSDVDTAQKVLVDLAAGAGPDAVRVTNATYQTLIDADAAQPADACLASDPQIADGLDAGLIDGITVDGTAYQVPWYVTPSALFYNVDLFERAGLDPDDPPRTMSEFHEAAAAIAATGVGGGTAYFGNDYNFQTYLASLGGSAYDPETGELGIDSPEGADVFEAFASMAADGSSPVYSNFFVEANEAFAGGQLGMIVSSASGYPSLAANGSVDIRIAPVPTMDGGDPVTATSTNGFVITTTDPARQEAVCQALLSVLTPQSVTQTVSATATIPLLDSVVDDPSYLAPVYEANPDWVAVREQSTTPWVSLPGGASAEYTSAYNDTQLQVLRGDITGAEAAASLQAIAQQLLQEQR